MQAELELKLFTNYDSIFRDRHRSPQQTTMAWGIDTPDQWYDVIDELCTKLKHLEEVHGCEVVATQVKEKFGMLRFYYWCPNGASDEAYEEIDNLIGEAEAKTAKICIKCGSNEGEFIRTGWIHVECPDCSNNSRNVASGDNHSQS